MARNSVTGHFQDVEIVFSIDSDCIIMSVRNLTDADKRIRVMYQKLSMSGLANWAQFELKNTPFSRRLPTEILDAYRLTFFVDNAEPVSARMEKILDELQTLGAEQPAETIPENTAEIEATEIEALKQTRNEGSAPTPALKPSADATPLNATSPSDATNTDENPATEIEATQQAEEPETHLPDVETPEPVATTVDEEEQRLYADETIQQMAENAEPIPPTVEQQSEERPASPSIISKLPPAYRPKSASRTVSTSIEFKIEVPSLPPSALAERRKAEAAKLNARGTKSGRMSSKRKEKSVFGHLAKALGFTAGGRRGKAYYQEKGVAIQNEFQDQLAKLERDYNDGYGLDLSNWKPETLCEEEIAILLLNLMVNEVIVWRKEIGRATHETEHLIQTLDEVDIRLRQTLKQTRGMSTPSPTLFPNLSAENERDLEKIQNECDAYLQRFASKLTEREKGHASKVEIIIFKKFLIEFIRDFLFVEVTKHINGNELPERLEWFLDLVDSEVLPIEIGVTRVSQNHHKVKGALACEFEPGTIVEVVSPGLQSTDGKRVSQMAVVIEAG